MSAFSTMESRHVPSEVTIQLEHRCFDLNKRADCSLHGVVLVLRVHM
jgi:hypothetical protein